MSMPWPCLLVLLLVLVVFTSQLEWKQQFGDENETSPAISYKERYISKREETVREKIILSQEKNIQKLDELVRSLRELLEQCREETEVQNVTTKPLPETFPEKHHIFEES